ncbi:MULTISPECIES: FecR domain-containing protein [unclassified Carboxylicivirga]|uniref:FecR domain-containing protein n=1 Tax=Carboxylicivirga TaxID=1628153 RepID=UPI003D3257B2
MSVISEEKIIGWALAYHTCEALSPEDKKAFEQWLKESPKHVEQINGYRQMYLTARKSAFAKVVDEEAAWAKISCRTKAKPPKRRLWTQLSSAAAVLMVGLLTTWFVYDEISSVTQSEPRLIVEQVEAGSAKARLTLADGSQVNLTDSVEQSFNEVDGTAIVKDEDNNLRYSSGNVSNELIYNTIEVPRGGEFALTLSDGTKVWINAESQLRYPVRFGEENRTVYLNGEAYFEVAHHAKRPFIVHAKDTKVKVLGTRFNISSYDDEAIVATTLVSGKVKVNYLADEVLLQPGQQSRVTKGRDGIGVQEVDSGVYTAWVHGVFEFEDMPLEQLCKQLGRWYDVNFFFTRPADKGIRFTGAFKRNQNIGHALDLIEQLTNVQFQTQGRNIIVAN